MIVSHDRYFMDKVVDHLFVFEGEGIIKDFPGSYSVYREYIRLNQKEKTKPEQKKSEEKVKENQLKTKLTYKEKLELEKLEEEISGLEKEKSDLETEIGSGSCSPDELVGKSQRIGEIMEVLEDKEMRWLELSEFEG